VAQVVGCILVLLQAKDDFVQAGNCGLDKT